jgi:hypothetical protein
LTKTIKLAAALAVAALAVPAAAAATPGNGQGPPDHAGPPGGPPGLTDGDSQDISNGGGDGSHVNAGSKGKCPKVGYVFKGTYTGTAVTVESGNKHVRKAELVGTDVVFDAATAKLVVADTNGDGVTDIADVEAGDRVLVTAKLAKCDPGDGPYAAKQFVDQTNPPLDEVDNTEE